LLSRHVISIIIFSPYNAVCCVIDVAHPVAA